MKKKGLGAIHFLLNKKLRHLIGDFNYRRFTSSITYWVRLRKNYKLTPVANVKPYIIYMADGKLPHGGLADRIKGMVSLYMYCKRRDQPFKIFFAHPFPLKDYLETNHYDWTVSPDELSYNRKQAKAVIVKYSYLDGTGHEYVDACLDKLAGKRQLHVYTNAATVDETFCDAFHELFKPSVALQAEIDANLTELGDDFVSITYRFQQLLGDFQEGGYTVLGESDRNVLINHCLNFIDEVRQQNPIVKRVLLTSDSRMFLDIAASKFCYVYTIPGKVYHIDHTSQAGTLPYLKSFVDLFVLSHAQTLYNYSEGLMYRSSGFASLAAVIGGKKYKNVHRD